ARAQHVYHFPECGHAVYPIGGGGSLYGAPHNSQEAFGIRPVIHDQLAEDLFSVEFNIKAMTACGIKGQTLGPGPLGNRYAVCPVGYDDGCPAIFQSGRKIPACALCEKGIVYVELNAVVATFDLPKSWRPEVRDHWGPKSPYHFAIAVVSALRERLHK